MDAMDKSFLAVFFSLERFNFEDKVLQAGFLVFWSYLNDSSRDIWKNESDKYLAGVHR